MKKENKPSLSSSMMMGSSSKSVSHPTSSILAQPSTSIYEPINSTPSRNVSSSKLNSYLTPENEKYGLVTSSPRDHSLLQSITGSKVDLSEELASQIEYNNALLKELQTMERKVQDVNKELSFKDQELRNSAQEKYALQNKIDKLQGEMYNAQFIIDRLEHENSTVKDQLEVAKRKNQEIQNEMKENLDKLDISTQQLADRNSQTKDLEHEIAMMKDKCDKYEEEISHLQYQMDDYANQIVNEKNQNMDLQKQYDQEKDDFLNDTQRLSEDIDKLKRELIMSDKERDRIVFEKDLAEKKIYDLETQLESQTIQTNEKIRKSNEEYDHLMKQFKQLSQEYSSLKTIHYKYLGDVQNELRDICSSMYNVKDRYSSLSQQVRDAQTFSRSLLTSENSQTEVIVSEMKTLIEERSRSIAELQMVTDHSHTMEVKLEEEKSRSIMFEERASKFEQQLQDMQQRVKLTERELSIKHAQQVDKLNSEIENQKGTMKRLEDDIAKLKKGQQNLQKSKSDVEESERNTQKENRVLTESIRKLQRQLEETKRYLSIVQSDRNNVHTEKENLRKELHEILNTQRNSNLSNNLSNSLSVPSLNLSQPSNNERFSNHSIDISIPTLSESSNNLDIPNTTSQSGVSFASSNNQGSSHGNSLGVVGEGSFNPRSRSKSKFMFLPPGSPKQTLAEIIPRTSISKIDDPNTEAIVLDSPLQNDDSENLQEQTPFEDDEEILGDEDLINYRRQYSAANGNDDLTNELSASFDYVVEEDEEEPRVSSFDNSYHEFNGNQQEYTPTTHTEYSHHGDNDN